MGLTHGKMEGNTSVAMSLIRRVGLVNITGTMVGSLKGNGQMGKGMGKVE